MKIWVGALVLGLATSFPTVAHGQGNQALGPTDADLYCAGYFTHRSIDAGMTVLSSPDGGSKNEYADHDIIYLTRGQGASPGTELMVVRPVYDINPRESFPGQKKMWVGLGTLYAEIARIQIRVVNAESLTAEVTHACEPILAGDLVIPLASRSAPAYRLPKLVDRFAPASGLPTGVVVAAKELQQNVGEGQIVYVNLGSSHGVEVGTYLRVFRTSVQSSDDPLESAMREYLTEGMGGQRVGRKLTPAELASLPRKVLGEVMVIAAEDGSSTGIITYSREEIVLGDMVEIESPADARLTPPTLTCTGNPAEVEAGQPVRLTAMGVPSTGAQISYTWTTNGGTIQGIGPMVTLQTAGLAAGTYVATVRASEATGLSADCDVTITVLTPRPPTVTLTVNPPRVQIGGAINATATATSPDNRPLTYQWRVEPRGRVEGTGENVRIDTTNMQPGNYTARVVVTDDRGLSAEAPAPFGVEPPPTQPPPPTVSKFDECQFARNSARVDNVCKAKLDDVALRLQSEADATLVIVGYSESNEANLAQLAQSRANNVRAYLTQDQGLAAGRLDVRTGTGAVGTEYRRVDLYLVPRGATFTGARVFPLVDEETPALAEQAQEPATLMTPVPMAGKSKRAVIARSHWTILECHLFWPDCYEDRSS